MERESVTAYEDLWTTDVDRYRLILLNDVDLTDGAVIFDVVSGGPLVIETDQEVLDEVLRNMIAAGAATISRDEATRIGEQASRRLLADTPTVLHRRRSGRKGDTE
jgi:hypothetical protein